MDSLITAAARALAVGDPLGALKHVALRDDPPALALRGIAMAQLGDFARAMALLRAGTSVTDACMEVGCTSLGSFSSRFTEIVGVTPSEYRSGEHHAVKAMPTCIAKQQTRPERNGTKNLSRIEEAPASQLQ